MEKEMRRSRVWELLTASKPSQAQKPNIDIALKLVCEAMAVKNTIHIKPVLQDELKAYNRHREKQRSVSKGYYILSESILLEKNIIYRPPNICLKCIL